MRLQENNNEKHSRHYILRNFNVFPRGQRPIIYLVCEHKQKQPPKNMKQALMGITQLPEEYCSESLRTSPGVS
jgi:hypothetical protein